MPYIIIVYDIKVQRLMKVHKFLKEYLHWSQNSVFEGETTMANLKIIETRLSELIKKEEDSIFIYSIASKKNVKRKILGIEKKPVTFTL